MKLRVLLRRMHYWGSLVAMLPAGLIIVAGLFLLLKKEIDWIQPPTAKGVERTAVPTQSFEDLFAAAQAVPELALSNWDDLDRVDVKPGKGVVKFIASNNWEAQIDTHTGDVLRVAYRRSDTIEKLHDGSFFADWVKLYVFFPVGLVLLGLWATGIYLFFLTRVQRWRKRRKA